MTREVKSGVPVVDQLSAFEEDGYTKRSGLLAGDFFSEIYLEGAPTVLVPTITEIGSSGEYLFQFTPTSYGLHEAQVLIDFNKDWWHAQYMSVQDLTNVQALKIDKRATDTPATAVTGSFMDRLMNRGGSKTYLQATDSLEAIRDTVDLLSSSSTADLTQIRADLSRVLGLLHKNAMLDKQVYDGQGQLTSARLRVFDTAAHVPLVTGGYETTGLLHEYLIEATYAGLNVVTKFTLKTVL